MKWRVEIAETVFYTTTVEAETVEEARSAALELHSEGLTSESDSSAGEISEIRPLARGGVRS